LEPSSSSKGGRQSGDLGARLVIFLDRVALGGLTLGFCLYILPLWREGRLRYALFVTLISTLLHIYTSHQRSP
jgi:hypothetical protein